MSVKTDVYDVLTHEERLTAVYTAYARGDLEEVEKLHRTCPKRTYQMPDAKYYEKFQRINLTWVALELLMTQCLLSVWIIGFKDKHAQKCLLRMHAIQEAWKRILADHGLDWDKVKSAGPPRHCVINDFLTVVQEPDEKQIESLYSEFKFELFT